MAEKQITQMNQLQRLIDEVDKVSLDRDAPTVGAFLASVMTGQDPRPVDSPLYTLVKNIAFREFTMGGNAFPTPEEWQELTAIVLGSGLYQRAPVDINLSTRAAEKLMEYLHAKMKAVEVNTTLDANVQIKPLEDGDLEQFKKVFSDEF